MEKTFGTMSGKTSTADDSELVCDEKTKVELVKTFKILEEAICVRFIELTIGVVAETKDIVFVVTTVEVVKIVVVIFPEEEIVGLVPLSDETLFD